MLGNSGKSSSDLIKSSRLRQWVYLGMALLFLLAGSADRSAVAIGQDPTAGDLWQDESPTLNLTTPGQEPQRVLRLDILALRRLLAGAPDEAYREADDRRVELSLPMPDGSFQRFRIEESAIMDGQLAARYPEIKTYSGQSIDDPAVTMRCDQTPQGFHATLIQADQSIVSIFPENQHSQMAGGSERSARYVSSPGTAPGGGATNVLEVATNNLERLALITPSRGTPYQSGEALRIYRIAIATTWEYSNSFGGGTNLGTVASMVTWLNGVNAIYERELTIRLQLIDAPKVIYSTEQGFSATTDPFTNDDHAMMITHQLGPVMASVGTSNFDVGHVLAAGAGGVAYLGVVNNDSTFNGQTPVGGPLKGLGVTSISGSTGNSVGLLTLLRGLGHQFGATHSFSSTIGDCEGKRSRSSAFEPGSGLTIMSYAGLCSSDNIVSAEDVNFRFHIGSMKQIFNHIQNNARSFTSVQTGNSPPTVDAGPDYTIPMGTPFELRAKGGDQDVSDVPHLTYVWEQTDVDGHDITSTGEQLFRSYAPSHSPSRFFPSLPYILNNSNHPPEVVGGLRVAESLPMVDRDLNFGVVVRDNRAGGGGIAEDSVRLKVAGNAGPFQITSPNTVMSMTAGSPLTVQWDVNNTRDAPVNCAKVRISLSTDNGQTFLTDLSGETANDGSETVILPAGVTTTQARVKVAAVGNIFFDISDVEFSITSSSSTLTQSSPTVSIWHAMPRYLLEGNGQQVFTITRENGSLYDLAVYVDVEGSATADFDYIFLEEEGVTFNRALARLTVNFKANEKAKKVVIRSRFDTINEVLEDVELRLQYANGYVISNENQFAFADILDSDITGSERLFERSFENKNPINVPTHGAATSNINVSGMQGKIERIEVVIKDLVHDYPDDLDILLVGPDGRASILMSDCGGSKPIRGGTFWFNEGANNVFGCDGSSNDGKPFLAYIKPVDNNYSIGSSPDFFPSPAPSGPYTASLSLFDDSDPNGLWTLYVVDDTQLDGGSILRGWSLTIYTGSLSTNQIIIPSRASATMTGTTGTYPSTVNYLARPISGSVIGRIRVTLNGFSHPNPQGVRIVLEGPTGVKSFLMANNGGSNAVNDACITFDSLNNNPLPTRIVSGTYSPTVITSPPLFSLPYLPGQYQFGLFAFIGTNPTGNWRLYVIDENTGTRGTINEWGLQIFTSYAVANGIYDDRSQNWHYGRNGSNGCNVGFWNTTVHSSAHNGTLTYANVVGSIARYIIFGSAFRLFYTQDTNRGILGIYVNGLKRAEVNANGPTAFKRTYVLTDLGLGTNGIHYIDIVYERGGSLIDIDAIEVFTPRPPLGDGIYDDQHPNFQYTGIWGNTTHSSAYNRTLTYTPNIGAAAEFHIVGTAFRILYTKATNRGKMAIFVDGAQIAVVNANNNLAFQEVFERTGLINANHLIRIQYEGGGELIDIDAIEVFSPPIALGPGTYDDTHPNWLFTGNWHTTSNSSAINGSLTYTQIPNANAWFHIRGTAFAIFYTRNQNRGRMGIYVDGQKIEEVNAKGDLAFKRVFYKTGLSSGLHSVMIRHEGGGDIIDIDTIEVWPTFPVAEAGIYDDRYLGWFYSGNWVSANQDGPYNRTITYTNDVSATAWIFIKGAGFRLRYTRFTNRGSLAIFVDGEQVVSQSAVGPLGWQMVYERRGLSAGDHIIEIRHGGGGSFIDIDAIEVFPSPLGTGIYDDRHSNWVYSGGWLTATLDGPYSRTLTYTDDVSARASILINGTAFRLRYTRFTNRGSLAIFVDGVQVASLSTAGSLSWQRVYERSGLTNGIHTVEIRHGGTDGSFIDIDGIEVF